MYSNLALPIQGVSLFSGHEFLRKQECSITIIPLSPSFGLAKEMDGAAFAALEQRHLSLDTDFHSLGSAVSLSSAYHSLDSPLSILLALI
ncbi:unnamed protein product [Heligmosomoides polygyrus]|uniref:Uncharacterized protein n=1 Tax=Heligmosomoides polygyrus TaxID=6339 RepID=A0A183FUN6_HELPZ|nr:unnamed protein product [Heligmosomoides polygyrus]